MGIPCLIDVKCGSPRARKGKHKDLIMNKLELVEHIASQTESTKIQATAALDAVLNGITAALKNGEEVRLVGFGTFSVKKREATTGRNPSTGKEIEIAASNNAKFKPGTALKEALNG
jgi:DNA-binding protein HU-beta